jgi:hypothetical protein
MQVVFIFYYAMKIYYVKTVNIFKSNKQYNKYLNLSNDAETQNKYICIYTYFLLYTYINGRRNVYLFKKNICIP